MAHKGSAVDQAGDDGAGVAPTTNEVHQLAMQDAFVRSARGAGERPIQQGGCISPEEMLKRMDDPLEIARLDPRLPKAEGVKRHPWMAVRRA